jgi:lambda repressor-like predicted transcriptional regulator
MRYKNMEYEEKNLSTIIATAMKTKGINVEKLAQLTGISDRFIESIVEEDFKKLPSSPYVHGYILKIAEALNLNGEELWEEYFKKNNEIKRAGSQDELPGNRFVMKHMNKHMVLGMVVAIIVIVFIFWRIQSHVGEPSLSLVDFKDEMIVEQNTFDLRGKIDPRDQLIFNEEVLYPDTDGNFEKKISLEPGFNTLTFKIKKFLGKEYIIKKQIFLKVATSSEEKTKNTNPTSQLETTTTEYNGTE